MKIHNILYFLAIAFLFSECKKEEKKLTWDDLAVNQGTIEYRFLGKEPYNGKNVDTTITLNTKSLTNLTEVSAKAYLQGTDTCVMMACGYNMMDLFMLQVKKKNIPEVGFIAIVPIKTGNTTELYYLNSSLLQDSEINFTTWDLENGKIKGTFFLDLESGGNNSTINGTFDMPVVFVELYNPVI